MQQKTDHVEGALPCENDTRKEHLTRNTNTAAMTLKFNAWHSVIQINDTHPINFLGGNQSVRTFEKTTQPVWHRF